MYQRGAIMATRVQRIMTQPIVRARYTACERLCVRPARGPGRISDRRVAAWPTDQRLFGQRTDSLGRGRDDSVPPMHARTHTWSTHAH